MEYTVVTLVTPIDYVARIYKAIDAYNDEFDTSLRSYDVAILTILSRAKTGLRTMLLMDEIRRKCSTDRFHATIDRLLKWKYITRQRYGNATIYNITLAGKQALETLNARLITITHEILAKTSA